MEDNLNFFINIRQLQFFGKWKTISIFSKLKTRLIFWQIEDDINIFANGRRPQSLVNLRQPRYFGKWKTTSKLRQMEDTLNILTKYEIEFFLKSQDFFRVG